MKEFRPSTNPLPCLPFFPWTILLWSILLWPSFSPAAEKKDSINALFIGNSYTARHNLAKVVESFAEAGNPDLDFVPNSVIYGGRRLVDHWRLGTQNTVNAIAVTGADIEASIASLESDIAKDSKDNYAKSAIAKQRALLASLEERRTTWDLVVLQSYRDDLEGGKSLYHQYAPWFAKLAKAQGARVLLYETTPATQNAQPLTTPPDPAPVLEKAQGIATLADELDAAVAPMSLVALRCQQQRPDLTLRFVNDAHLNKVLAYLTACTMYAALFEKSPEGLPIDSITDIRYFEKDKKVDKTKDRDGNPITRKFSPNDRADLQRIAWESWSEFQQMRRQ